jgi:hypothetical protein
MADKSTGRRIETHIFPAFVCDDNKTEVIKVVVTQKGESRDCRDFHEAKMEISSYKISGRGRKIQ